MKKPWRPPKNNPSPNKHILERAAARELVTTWLGLKDKELIERHLSKMDKLYGKGAEQRIRDYMKQIYRDERCG